MANKGDGFELSLKPKDGFNKEKPKVFGFFNKGTETDYQALSTSGILLNAQGMSDKLSVKLDKESGWAILCYDGQPCTFGIRPFVNNIRPGDDIFISASIKKEETPGTYSTLFSSTPVDDSYLAVYDKKMLWRANLYIAENEVEDWNHLHPWKAPPSAASYSAMSQAEKDAITWWDPNWGYNEWNRGYAFAATFNQDAMPVAEAIKDGEQAMQPWSFIWTGNQPCDTGAVAYSIGCHDSPFEFNNKMDHQKTILNYRFGTHVAPYDKQEGTPLTYVRTQWAETQSPQNRYVSGKPATTDEEKNRRQWDNYADGATGTAIAEYSGVGSAAIANGTYYPYRPGYSSERHAAVTAATYEANWGTYTAQSAGVDCVGLVVRSLSYTDKPYVHRSLKGRVWTSPAESRDFPAIESGGNGMTATLWKLTAKVDGIYNPITKENDYPGLNLLVPGDVIYYPGHVMMVAEVKRSETGEVRPEDVRIIEAVEGNFENSNVTTHFRSATRTRSLQWPGVMGKNWIIGRLK